MDNFFHDINWDNVKSAKWNILDIEELEEIIINLIDSSITSVEEENFETPTYSIDFKKSIFSKHKLSIKLIKEDRISVKLKIEYENGYIDGGVIFPENIKTIQELKEKINLKKIQVNLKELYFFRFTEIERW